MGTADHAVLNIKGQKPEKTLASIGENSHREPGDSAMRACESCMLAR